MALALASDVVKSEGLRHVVALRLTGPADELRSVRDVEYDLGPTFDNRYRRPQPSADAPSVTNDEGFAIEVMAYGDFTVVARVAREGESTTLTGRCTLPSSEGLGATSDKSPPVSYAPPASASARAALGGQVVISAITVALGILMVAVWPDGSPTVGLLGWQLRLSEDARFVALAAAAGGLGALVQAALTLATYFEQRTLYPSWIGWYVLRAPTGMASGVLTYALLRAGLLPGAAPGVLSPFGLTAIALLAGFATPRLTTALLDVSRASLGSPPAPRALVELAASAGDAPPAREPDVARAEMALRGQDLPAQEIYELAERLRRINEFGYARRLYGRIRKQNDWAQLKVTAVKVGQRHALATYKDPDLPAGDRFRRALDILDEVDKLDFGAPATGADAERSERLAIAQRQESLGLRGAVHKRRWQIEGQRVDLERALGFYLRGYQIGTAFPGNQLGVETDQGYNGINAAFVLDLLAREDARHACYAGVISPTAVQRSADAGAIRERLVERLPALLTNPAFAWMRTEWWFYATLAEAYFGLGRFEDAVAALRAYNAAHGLPHTGPPLDTPPSGRPGTIASWEFESTFTQLTSLAVLHVELTELLGDGAASVAQETPRETPLTDRGRRVLRDYLGDFAPALDRAEIGKLGLALSGGGFRASLYHIGVLAHLAERDALRRVEVLSCVSGGSIVGAHYYLLVKQLLETTPDAEITREHYVAIVERLARDFVAGVQTNIRAQVFGSIWANLRAFFQPRYTTTRRLGALYERELYARVEDRQQTGGRVLSDLFVAPKGEAEFKPKYDNWRRRAKVPMLVLNATTLNTGHNWQFTASWMGEPPIGLDAEIEGNYRLRRMYYAEAPRLKDRWRHWYTRPFAPPDYQRIRLGEAVAASSCVPGLFEPLVLPDLFEGKIVRLVDGGVHDNQGIASLIEQDCTVMLVSDASGQMETQDNPPAGRLGVSLRSFNISMTRVRQAQFRELAARTRSGLLRGLVFLHLKRDLDADPVDWRECQDPYDASDDARSAVRRGVLTDYGVHKSVQQPLAGLRTDLDSFTELEAFALMTSGYRQAQAQLARMTPRVDAPPSPRQWPFLEVEPLLAPGPAFEEVKRQLTIGGRTALKVWFLSPVLQAVGVALVATAAYGLFRAWQTYYDRPLVTVGALGVIVLALVASLLLPHVVALVRYQDTARRIGLRSAVAAVLAVAFKVHLLVFDPLFQRLGRLARLQRAARAGADSTPAPQR